MVLREKHFCLPGRTNYGQEQNENVFIIQKFVQKMIKNFKMVNIKPSMEPHARSLPGPLSRSSSTGVSHPGSIWPRDSR